MEQQEIYSEEEEIIEEEEEEEIIEELVVEESYDEEYEEESVEEEVVVEEIIEEEVIEEEEVVGTDEEEETVAGEEQSIEEEDEAAIKQQFLIQEQAPAYEMAMDGDYDKLKGTLMLLKAQFEENGSSTQQQLQRGISRYVDAVDEHGRSALHYACSQNSLQMAVLLLSPPFGADPNQPDGEGYPPLHVPCERGYALMVQILLKFGANADHRVFLEEDDDDREDADDDDPHYRGVPSVSTPLLAAIFLERTEVVKLLLEHGANPNVVTDTAQGKKSALELAAEIIHNPDMAELLRRHNAVAVPSCQPASPPNKSSPNDHLPKWMEGF